MSIPGCVNSLIKSVCDHICLFDVFECRFVRCADDEEDGAWGVFLGLASPEPPESKGIVLVITARLLENKKVFGLRFSNGLQQKNPYASKFHTIIYLNIKTYTIETLLGAIHE